MNSKIETLLRFDLIRASKLLEISQASVISLILSIYAGVSLDKLFGSVFDSNRKLNDISMIRLLYETILQFVAVIIMAYYVGKIVEVIPFMFSLTSDYTPGKKGETKRGIAIGTKIIFVLVQSNMTIKIKELARRMKNY